jgi:hypothetical protein
MKRLSVPHIVQLHSMLLSQTGGLEGIRDVLVTTIMKSKKSYEEILRF